MNPLMDAVKMNEELRHLDRIGVRATALDAAHRRLVVLQSYVNIWKFACFVAGLIFLWWHATVHLIVGFAFALFGQHIILNVALNVWTDRKLKEINARLPAPPFPAAVDRNSN
jgi:hypothetical protein